MGVRTVARGAMSIAFLTVFLEGVIAGTPMRGDRL